MKTEQVGVTNSESSVSWHTAQTKPSSDPVFQEPVQNIGCSIYLLSADGVVKTRSAGARAAEGYDADEIIGQHFSCFYSAEEQIAGVPAQNLELAKTNGKFEAGRWRVRKDGTRFWAHAIIQPIYDDEGALFGFAKITRDCSEERETSLALEETTRNLHLALGNMSHGLCLFNRRGRLVLSNDKFSHMLSLASGALPAGMRLSTMLRRIGERAGMPLAQTAAWVRTVRSQLVQRFEADQQQATVEIAHLGRSIAVVTRLLEHGGWVSTIEDVTERRIAEKRITHLAHHDHLTDLPNRLRFQERLSELAANASAERPFALLFLDPDRFKSVNDTLGHHAGDELLKAVAQRLASTVRATDQLARLSGDEFAILQIPFRSVDGAAELAQQCIENLAAPFEIGGNEISVGASIGIVVHARAGIDAGTVLQRADVALYAAKRDGRNCFRLYESSMNNPIRLRNELEDDLRRALRANQLELHYQPIVDAHSGITTACEALLRWHHPKRGAISPADFIPIAEERGLMPELGAWVLEKACHDAAMWPTHIRLSVNVSPAQLIHANFTHILANALKKARLPAHRLEVEITETVLLESSRTSSRILNEIRAMGVGVAMDDFGKGYSSLGLLQSVPFTRVKIDRGFVNGLGNNPKSAAIIHAITELCRSLDLPITAEGVETGDQRQALLDERCHELQGFFFARPAPAVALERYLNA